MVLLALYVGSPTFPPQPDYWPAEPIPAIVVGISAAVEMGGIILSLLLQCGLETTDDSVYHLHDSAETGTLNAAVYDRPHQDRHSGYGSYAAGYRDPL